MVRHNLNLAIVLLFTAVCCLSAKAQGPTDDFGAWFNISFKKDLTDRIDFTIDQEIRMEDNARLLGRSSNNVGLDFELLDWAQIGANYRFLINRRGDGSYGQRHRTMLDLQLEKSIRRIGFSYKFRHQWEISTVNYGEDIDYLPTRDMRHKIGLNYLLNRVYQPYITVEARFILFDPDEPYYQGFNRHRIQVGTEILLADNRELDVYFLLSRDWYVLEADREFIIGIEFTFESAGDLFEN